MLDKALHAHRTIRNRALLEAERDRERVVRDAEIEYSETVAKLREAYHADLAAAAALRRERVLPAHRAYNAAVIAAEVAYVAGYAAYARG